MHTPKRLAGPGFLACLANFARLATFVRHQGASGQIFRHASQSDPSKASSVPWQPNCNGAILISAGANLRQTLPPSAVKLSKKEAQKIEIRATRKFVLL
jgi:hypothetical protein